MLKKLYKHEMLSYLRQWLPIEIIIVALSVMGRIVQIFESDTTAYSIVFGSTVFFYVISLFASFVLSFVVCIKRFYNNLFTGEGYLSFTLPVTPSQHIFVKAFAAMTVELSTTVIALLSVCIFTAGDVCNEIFKAVAYLISNTFQVAQIHIVLFIIEMIVLLLISMLSGTFYIYTCIAIGQTFNQNRVAWSIGIYFIGQFIIQILSTVVSVVFSVFGQNIMLNQWAEFIYRSPYTSTHLFFILSILLSLFITAVFYLITHHMIKKKLNLE